MANRPTPEPQPLSDAELEELRQDVAGCRPVSEGGVSRWPEVVLRLLATITAAREQGRQEERRWLKARLLQSRDLRELDRALAVRMRAHRKETPDAE